MLIWHIFKYTKGYILVKRINLRIKFSNSKGCLRKSFGKANKFENQIFQFKRLFKKEFYIALMQFLFL